MIVGSGGSSAAVGAHLPLERSAPDPRDKLANVPNMTTDDAFSWTAPLSADLFKGDDAKEGMAAFLEK